MTQGAQSRENPSPAMSEYVMYSIVTDCAKLAR
eukprot:CAMPEP_0172030348 /NCGR_PEP_ID=MMETSP1041-20130122/18670_1 /TAXON_ID=464988 /ORGANISM="Hemiselmis andersenii, Strain CCMP439" /LENGTH=32 /DNA_ID= /DNA_START= /DNA_END= /DNA_ORIENTATION=